MRIKRFLKEYYFYFIAVLIALIFLFIPKRSEGDLKKSVNLNHASREVISVTIEGEVKNKGIKYFYKGAKLKDLLNVAQITDYSSLDGINLDEMLKDNYIYEIKKEMDGKVIVQNLNSSSVKDINKYTKVEVNKDDKININTASLDELIGIMSKTRALNVISYREKKEFETIDEIKNVSGIGDETFKAIKNFITC